MKPSAPPLGHAHLAHCLLAALLQVTDVHPADCAAQAGLPKSCIMLSINNVPVDNHAQAIDLVEADAIHLEVGGEMRPRPWRCT